MKNGLPISCASLTGLTFAAPDYSKIEKITALVSVAVFIIWGGTMLLNYIQNSRSKRKNDELNRKEQEAEIAKHKAEERAANRKYNCKCNER